MGNNTLWWLWARLSYDAAPTVRAARRLAAAAGRAVTPALTVAVLAGVTVYALALLMPAAP